MRVYHEEVNAVGETRWTTDGQKKKTNPIVSGAHVKTVSRYLATQATTQNIHFESY